MSQVWGVFVGKQHPSWFLQVVDQAVDAGRWSSRAEAFVDHARFALSVLEPDAAAEWTPQQLGEKLLEYAESFAGETAEHSA